MGPLRDSEFLSAIKHRSAIPGGTCDFDLPDYSYLAQSSGRDPRRRVRGLAGADPTAVRQHRGALWLTRQNAKRKSETAVGGFSSCNSIAKIPASWCG